MIIGSKTQYAVKTLVDLAGRKDGETTTVAGVASRRRIPPAYLEQILLQLKRGGMVMSRRGRHGGYTLTRKGAKATLADVMILAGDALLAQPAVSHEGDQTEQAVLRVWQDVNDQFLSSLMRVSIQTLSDAAQTLPASNYTI